MINISRVTRVVRVVPSYPSFDRFLTEFDRVLTEFDQTRVFWPISSNSPQWRADSEYSAESAEFYNTAFDTSSRFVFCFLSDFIFRIHLGYSYLGLISVCFLLPVQFCWFGLTFLFEAFWFGFGTSDFDWNNFVYWGKGMTLLLIYSSKV